ncbi:PIN domain-containing protein [Peziza echinospora]|nr:PIN domain-containing protein [Peziza echinospora]
MSSAYSYDNDGDVVMADLEEMSGIMDIVSHVHGERFTHGEIQSEAVVKPLVTHPRISDLSFIMVVDTSFILSHLHLIEAMVGLHETYRSVIVIPWATIQELDGLRKSSRRITITSSVGLGGSKYAKGAEKSVEVAMLARQAVNWQYKMFQSMNKGVWGQKKEESIETHRVGDDAILDCCRFFSEKKGLTTVLLSDDRNLCVKANIYDILTVSFEPGKVHTAKVILEKGVEISARLRGQIKPSPSPTNQLSPFAAPFYPLKAQEQTIHDKDAQMEDAPTPSPTTPVTPNFPTSIHAPKSHTQQPQNNPPPRQHGSGSKVSSTQAPALQPPKSAREAKLQHIITDIHHEIMYVIPELMQAYASICLDGEDGLEYLNINFKNAANLEDIENGIIVHWFAIFSTCMMWDVKTKAQGRYYSAPYKNALPTLASVARPGRNELVRWAEGLMGLWKSLYSAVSASGNRPNDLDMQKLDPKKASQWGALIQAAEL